MSWYFAYGSNMDAARLFGARLGPAGAAAGERIAGRLDGWRLAFNKPARTPVGSSAANIVPADGASVFGTLNLLSEAGFTVLDRYEGVAAGHYRRCTAAVVRPDTGELLEAITYVAVLTGEDLKPTRAYLAHLLAGKDLLPADYLRRLAATPTFD